MALTGRTIGTEALISIGVIAQGDDAPAENLSFALSKLATIVDAWNAQRQAIYNVDFLEFTLIGGNAAPTLGPTGDWTVSARPVAILGANTVQTTVNPVVRTPINIRDDTWWLRNMVRGVTSQFPTDLYYSPQWPNGVVNLYPVPTLNYGIELEVPIQLDTFAPNSAFSMPQGYRAALTDTLSEVLAESYGIVCPAKLERRALEGRVRIFGNNVTVPRIRTRDSGMPTAHSRSYTTYNYRTGLFE
jgi:hypothetical protein